MLSNGELIELHELRSRLHKIGVVRHKRITYLEGEIDTMRSELILAYKVIDQLPEGAFEHCDTSDLLNLMRKTEQTSKLEMVKTEMDDRLERMKEQNKKLKHDLSQTEHDRLRRTHVTLKEQRDHSDLIVKDFQALYESCKKERDAIKAKLKTVEVEMDDRLTRMRKRIAQFKDVLESVSRGKCLAYKGGCEPPHIFKLENVERLCVSCLAGEVLRNK